MNNAQTTTLRDRVLEHDDDLRDLLQLLLRRANRRQLWLTFIDDRGCLGDPLMPMADYPEDPTELTTVDDLGTVPEAHLLMSRMGMLCEVTGNREVVIVWERIGGSDLDDDVRAWVREMGRWARELGIRLRAQFLLHSRGVRQLHPDDYL